MASPIGHALAGLAVAWAADLLPIHRPATLRSRPESWYRQAGGGLALTCMALAAAPDLDLLITGLHRTVTHSFLSVVGVGLAAAIVWSRRLPESPIPLARIGVVCAVAWASHIGVDWMSADSSSPRGMQILWPFADAWYISGWDLFPGTERRRLLSAASLRINARALVTELALFLPILLILWRVRVKAAAGLPSELACGHHPPE